jgi:hypothetical protein
MGFHRRCEIRGWIVEVALVAVALSLACGVPSIALQNPTPSATPIPRAPAPTSEPSLTPLPTRAQPVSVPSWWPRDLDPPKNVDLTGNAKRIATWQTADMNADSIRDILVQQGANAGYRTVVLIKSMGAIYDVLFAKGTSVYTINITQGANKTILTANLGALIHLKATGAANIEVDLPVKDPMNTSAGGEMFIGTEIPNTQCPGCIYVVFIHIAPFKGPGIYASKPSGIYIIDALIVPGGDPLKADYRWADDCTVVVKDSMSGTFQCVGLSNIYDTARKIDISGSWIQPPPP